MNANLTFRNLQSTSQPDLVAALMALGAAIAPTRRFRSVTPHDTNPIAGGPARSLYIGVGGDVAAVNEAGDTVVFTDVPSGAILPIEAAVVKDTDTTATDIIAL